MLVQSNPFVKGALASEFNLPDTVTGKNVTLQDIRGEKGTIVMFICNHCPFVIHVNNQIVKLANDYKDQGFGFVAISSNDVEFFPQDGPKYMKDRAEQLAYPFPYLYDESQEVAKAYDAVCTPEFYVLDKDLKSVYHGQLDDSRPGNGLAVTGNSIRPVLDQLKAGKSYTGLEKPSIGCSIKWK